MLTIAVDNALNHMMDNKIRMTWDVHLIIILWDEHEMYYGPIKLTLKKRCRMCHFTLHFIKI